jgi:hypothetical protein
MGTSEGVKDKPPEQCPLRFDLVLLLLLSAASFLDQNKCDGVERRSLEIKRGARLSGRPSKNRANLIIGPQKWAACSSPAAAWHGPQMVAEKQRECGLVDGFVLVANGI